LKSRFSLGFTQALVGVAGVTLFVAGLFVYLYISTHIEVPPDDRRALSLIEADFAEAMDVVTAASNGFTLKLRNNRKCGTGPAYIVTYAFTGSQLTRFRMPCDTGATVLAPVTKYTVAYLDARDKQATSTAEIRGLIVRLGGPEETLTLIMRGPGRKP
jgi:hypothetical protein